MSPMETPLARLGRAFCERLIVNALAESSLPYLIGWDEGAKVFTIIADEISGVDISMDGAEKIQDDDLEGLIDLFEVRIENAISTLVLGLNARRTNTPNGLNKPIS
jgi:hypothetical protein